MRNTMSQDWKKNIRKVVPYVPGEQPKRKVIKLNTNENPYPPSPKVTEALEKLNTGCLKLYPDPDCMELRKILADYYGFTPEQVFVGVGSDDVLSVAFLTFFNAKEPVLFPNITYSFYNVWAELYRIPYRLIPVTEDFRIRKEDYFCQNGGIVFANPNAPTAIAEPLSFVEEIVKNNPASIVIVDEAYVDFGGESALELVDRYDNLLVVQTFSKSRSMAGMRIGYAIGQPELIKAMNDVKFSINSYTMNQTSLLIGGEAVKDDDYFKKTVKKIVDVREKTKEELTQLGFFCTDSKTNFLFVTHRDKPAKEIFEALKAQDIFVRYFSQPGIDNYLRITVGTEEEMTALMAALKKIV